MTLMIVVLMNNQLQKIELIILLIKTVIDKVNANKT